MLYIIEFAKILLRICMSIFGKVAGLVKKGVGRFSESSGDRTQTGTGGLVWKHVRERKGA